MADNTDRRKQVNLLQENLSAIRKIAGWTTEQLGDKIGVSKQTISNLENNKSPMNFTQYIAIRAVLDCEIEDRGDDDNTLAKVVYILLDKSEEMDDEEYNRIKVSMESVAAAAAGGLTGGALAGLLSSVLSTAVVSAGIVGGPIGMVGGAIGRFWLKKLLKKSIEKDEK